MFRTSPFLRWEKLRCSQQAKAHKKKPHKWLVYAIYEALFIYSGNPLYPQKAKSFILTYFLFQGILGLPSRSWLTLSFFSLSSLLSLDIPLFSRLSPWFQVKEKDLISTVFPLYKVFIFSLFYSFPRLKIFAP